MNKFEISIKQDGKYQPIQATPVFPFSWGELLDERLDEAYITLYDSPEKTYKRLTDVKVTITNRPRVKDEYFIIASDNSYELPVGSGKYKHDIYLIERTKLLEGIYCSSITFTNSKGIDYLISKSFAYGINVVDPGFSVYQYPFKSLVRTPLETGKIYTVPSAYSVANDLAAAIIENGNNPTIVKIEPKESATNVSTDQIVYTGLSATSDDGNPITALWQNTAEITPISRLGIVYTLVLQLTDTTGNIYTPMYRFLFNPTVVKNLLSLKRWSITDCITRACELAEPLFAGETPKYRLDGVEYDGNGKVIKEYEENGEVKKGYRPGTFAAKYDKVFAPEFTATEDTLREQLKLILSYVHAEPWLDENDVIKVTEYGGTKNSAAASLPYVYNAVSSHINEYCTEVRSHAQNLVSSLGYARGVITDPGNGLYRSVRSDTAYVRINEGNAMAVTNAPIYSIEKVYCGIATQDGSGWQLAPVEITPYVFEETEYSANLSSYAGGYPYSKQYAIYYTQGAPNLKGLFFKAPNAISTANFSHFAISNILSSVTGLNAEDIDNMLTDAVGGSASLVFSISYKPISSHFVSHGKQLYVKGETPYMQLYNQSENLVESQYYGENLRGVAARLGNIEKERTFILKNINDVPKVGEILDGYAISAVSCELYPFDIKCTVGLTKDFNRISEYVGINSQKRMYEISERAAVDRAILIKETLVIGKKPDGYDASSLIWGNLNPFYNTFRISNTTYNDKITTVIFKGTNAKGDSVSSSPVCLPVIARALGNVVTLNFAMKDNYSAGTKTQFIGSGDKDIQGRWEQDVPYSDYYGRIWYSSIFFIHSDSSILDGEAGELAKLAYKLPTTDDTFLEGVTRSAVKVENHILRKDNRERISYNVELDIKTDREDIIVGSALADLCGWVNSTPPRAGLRFFNPQYNSVGKFDRIYTPHNTDKYVGVYDSTDSSDQGWKIVKNPDNSLTLTINPLYKNYGWVICTPIKNETVTVEDEDGNETTETYVTGGEILLASNKPISETLTLDFYVVKN